MVAEISDEVRYFANKWNDLVAEFIVEMVEVYDAYMRATGGLPKRRGMH
jgi:hypothetical protein